MPLKNNYVNTFHGIINTKWKAVDEYATKHLHPTSRANTKSLQDTLAKSFAAGLPDYGLSPAQAKFLALHCKTANVKHVLELGTLGGYSAIWMASQNPGLHITTIEYDAHHVKTATQNIQSANLSSQIEVLQGSALDILPSLQTQIESGARPRFGFVFIDADKRNNWRYFQSAKGMVLPNAVVCIDNVVREGQLADEKDRDPGVVGSRELVEKVGREKGVEAVVLQTVGEKSYDGWLWAVVD